MLDEKDAKEFMQDIIKRIESQDESGESVLLLESEDVSKLYLLMNYILDAKFFDPPQ